MQPNGIVSVEMFQFLDIGITELWQIAQRGSCFPSTTSLPPTFTLRKLKVPNQDYYKITLGLQSQFTLVPEDLFRKGNSEQRVLKL